MLVASELLQNLVSFTESTVPEELAEDSFPATIWHWFPPRRW